MILKHSKHYTIKVALNGEATIFIDNVEARTLPSLYEARKLCDNDMNDGSRMCKHENQFRPATNDPNDQLYFFTDHVCTKCFKRI